VSVRRLESLFRPASIAVIGASDRPRSVGAVVMQNLLGGGFTGPILPVNPGREAVAGVLAYPDVASLPVPPELAVITTPPETLPGLVDELGRRGTRALVILTALGRDRRLQRTLLESAQRCGLRLLGPNCLGIVVPDAGLNASFAHVGTEPGELALVSQSGAVCTAALDWARRSGIGFSCVVSLGEGLEVDAGDLLDYLGGDPKTRAILLYLESVRDARKFLSAARAAARNKPVLVIKSGRGAAGVRAAASHSGALAGADDVIDAAIRRAGMLRVERIDELFAAAETLARPRRIRGDRLAVLTNGGGLAVMAADMLASRGGELAELAPETLRRLDALLPATWSRANPVDIIGDAPGERFAGALRILLDDPGADVVLVIHAPTAIASSEEAARAVAGAAGHANGRPVLASWLGHEEAETAERRLHEAGIPTYDTPEDAIAAFLHLVGFRRNQDLLMETPPSLPVGFEPDVEGARRTVEKALAEGRSLLDEPESKAVLAAFGIPCVETRVARSPEEAASLAGALGFPVALKILSPSITHKSDVGGVALDLDSAEDVIDAAQAMAGRLRALGPEAQLGGFTVQPMARRPGAHELLLGAATDPVFGPVVLFGQGGTAVEVIADRTVGLPPLNLHLARELVGRTRVARLLAGYRDRAPADLDAVCLALVQISQLLIEIPQVVELDVNPLLADAAGVLALDARVGVSAAVKRDRLAIRPYPRELEETIELKSGRRLLLRPIRPEDEPAHQAFLHRLQPDDIRFRFFNLVREMPHTQMARYTQIDYEREMAFIASDTALDPPATLGVVRGVFTSDDREAEFAIIVQSDLKGQGLGRALLEKLVRYCRARGTREVVGQVLPENQAMLALAKRLGFASRSLPEEGVVEVRLRLGERGAPRRRGPSQAARSPGR
jgi:acetyltransferase